MAFLNRDKLTDLIHKHIRHTVKNEYGVVETRTVSFDVLQQNLKCCGASGPSDWSGAKYNQIAHSIQNAGIVSNNDVSNKNKYSVPESCCKLNITRQQCEDSRSIVLTKSFNNNFIQSDVSILY